MNALFILDKEHKTRLSEELKDRILTLLNEKQYQVEVVEVGKVDAMPCLGCFRCITEHPGICATKDLIATVRNGAPRDLAIFLTPVVFGHFGATIKCAIDRGSGGLNNVQVMIGYSEDIEDEEKNTFIDLTLKHRGIADVVHPGMDKGVYAHITTCTGDNDSICQAFMQYIA
jgi:multimeric flavodoxin WrbA